MTLFDTLFAAQDLSRVLVLAMLSGIGVMIGGRLAKDSWSFLHPLLPGGVSGAFAALAVLLTLPLGQSPLTRWALTGLMLTGRLLLLIFNELGRYAKPRPRGDGPERCSDRPTLVRRISVSIASDILPYSVLLGAAAAASATTAMAVSAALVFANLEIGRQAIDNYRSAQVSRIDQVALLVLFSLLFIGIALSTFWALHGLAHSGRGWLAAIIPGFLIVASARALLRTGTGSVAANHITLPAFVGGFALLGLAISALGELSRELDVSNSTFQHSPAQSVTTTKRTEKGGR
ncbi:hypothetical protein [Croceicoccus sp. YJ47]|uniref:hypothetical protein n=1 Tax=Croceicoccus sp. YJ47 TaxID=2798724 RepID=UPI001921FD47|nr:hypothetical protein [Croceicoccus sp. YJ47]QQN75204.1 hypothetical protein JD971_05915 [Croceicoccus sp. YJ47]